MLNNDTAPATIVEENDHDELKVSFYPPLFLQRRMWILEILRAESVTKVRRFINRQSFEI
jgi:hypothetical protein